MNFNNKPFKWGALYNAPERRPIVCVWQKRVLFSKYFKLDGGELSGIDESKLLWLAHDFHNRVLIMLLFIIILISKSKQKNQNIAGSLTLI